ncbi:MAG TPA: alpha/beta fold hydrolase [Steroidobacteraceae bacterium]|nr:alpha/beta fold hydrolase [Steroidobacteraceae bacterium]
MSTLLLIHGAWHGAWCWYKLTPRLEAGGRRVLAPDLPSMGADTTPPAVITLDYWARFVADLAEREAEPVTLVAHSRGGVIASRAAELVPDRIRRIVYVAAYLLPARGTVATEARRDSHSLIPANMLPAASGVTCTVRAGVVREAFYGRCPDEDAGFACERLSPEPLKPLVTPLEITPERFGRVPRAYVETRFDRVISLAEQRRMQAALPCDPVFALDADHSPFLSQPDELARMLISI